MNHLQRSPDSAEGLQVNRAYVGDVDAYNSDGAGVIRVGGAVVFVPDAVRGERVQFRVTHVRKSVASGELLRVLTPSPERRQPDCPCFGTCGGCAFRHVSYREELYAKRQKVRDALTRIGGASLEELTIIGAETPLRYRNKSQYPVSAGGEIGFYRAGSHEVIPVRDCLLQPSVSNRTADAVRAWMSRYRVAGYDERTGKGLIRHVYVRVNRRGESLCCLVANAKTLPREPELVGMILDAVPRTVGVIININARRDNVILGGRYRVLWGRDFLCDTLRVADDFPELSFKISPASFYQVHPAQTEKLYALALDFAALTGPETVLDLYCGIGTITLCAAARARRVIGAEIVARAVSDAKENASRNGIGNAEFYCADASEMARRFAADALRPDVVIVDPPRKGLAPDVISAAASMNPARIVYVSCDPATLGRDLRRFSDCGYLLRRAAAVDMFPGTKHVETVVRLSQRRNAPDDCRMTHE